MLQKIGKPDWCHLELYSSLQCVLACKSCYCLRIFDFLHPLRNTTTSGRLRAGRISQKEWEPLGHSIVTLSQLPLFIDDRPNISVSEIRTKARQVMLEQGGTLGLIVVDYLQLLVGGNEDNRVQELAKITRSFKGLA